MGDYGNALCYCKKVIETTDYQQIRTLRLFKDILEVCFELTANEARVSELADNHSCHFFVANNDTPDCPEAESDSKLFIRTVYKYCAEAVIRMIWHKSEALAIYSGELLKKLFFK